MWYMMNDEYDESWMMNGEWMMNDEWMIND